MSINNQSSLRPRSKAAASVIISLLAAVLLVGCGSASSDVAEGEQTTPSSTETTTGSPEAEAETEHEHDHDHEGDHDHDHDDGDLESDRGESSSAPEPTGLEEARRLLVVGAFDQPIIDLVDLDDESTVTVDVEAPATLSSSTTESGRFLLAGHEDGVTVFDTGVWSERHGDHFHHYTSTPSIIDHIAGPSPSHLISNDELSALYFDGTGEAVVVDEASLEEGKIDVAATVATGQPHHGFAVPTQGAFVITVANDDMDQLPNLVGVSDPDGVIQEQYDCPLTHGETGLPNGAAAACGDGILLVSQNEGTWTSTHLPYPNVDDVDPYGYGPARAWALETSPSESFLAAPHGTHHLLLADLTDQTLTTYDLSRDIATLGVKINGDNQIVVLTLDGTLLNVDPEDGSIRASLKVINPFQEDDPEEPYRQLAISDGHAYISDPATSQVVEVSLDGELAVERTINLDFTPGFITIANGWQFVSSLQAASDAADMARPREVVRTR